MDRLRRVVLGKRGWQILFLFTMLSFIPIIVAAADYIGPANRTTTTETTYTLRVCYYNGQQYCSCVVDGGECNVTSNPCGDWRGGCDEYEKTKTTTVTLSNATASGSYTCATPGLNGWCKGSPRIDFTANEPASGYLITLIEGNLGVYCNPADAATVSCSWTPPQGANTVTYWAHSTYGDTSTQGTISGTVKVDSGLPTAGVGIGTPNGANGWFISPVTATATGTDGTSGIGALYVNIDGGAWQANGTAFTNQGAHTVQGLAQDNAGNQATSSTAAFNLDTVKPTLNTTIPTANGLNGWFKSGPISLSVSGTDATSGMSAAQIQVGAGAWQNNAAPISADGSYTVNFRTVDVAGNVNSTSSTIKLDQTPPAGTVSFAGTLGQNGWYVSKPNATVSGSDATSGVASSQVSVDGGAWAAIASVPDGVHAVSGQLTDNAGKSANTPNASVKVDTVAPTISASYSAPDGTNSWYVTPVDLSVSGTDATSGMAAAEIQIDGGAWLSNSTTLKTDGTHTVIFRTRDNAGNTNTQTVTFKVDLAGPTVAIVPTGTNGLAGWFTSNVSVAVSASDAVSGMASSEYRVDGGAWSPMGPSFSLTDGVHTVDIRSYDNANNASTATRTISVDTVPPVVKPTIPTPDGKGGWYVTNPDLVVTGTDATSGVSYSDIQIDGGAWTRDKVTATGDGPHNLVFRVTDVAGNASTSNTSIKIDTTNPVAAFTPIGTLGTGGWYTSSTVTGSVAVTDATSGVADVEYKIDGSAWTAGTTATLNTDGVHTLDFSYTDNAGNTATQTRTIKVDSTLPTIIPISTGTLGEDDWWTTIVVVDPNPIDVTSGVSKTEIKVNGGDWQTVDTVTLAEDGLYQVDVRITDNAGNVLTDTLDYKVDTTLPTCIISDPPIDKMLTGKITLTGKCVDAGSGIDTIVISVDGGKTWSDLTNTGGNWTYTWDTVLYPGPVIIKGTDHATNEEDTTHTYKVINELPRPDVQDQWYVWNAGYLKIWVGDLPVTKISISIADWKNRWPAREWNYDNVKDVPTEIKWDRKFADGTLAPIGDYAVRVTVWDSYNRTGHDEGKILIPSGPIPTAVISMETPTATATQTLVPTATSTRTPQQTAVPTLTTIPTTAPAAPVEQQRMHFLPILALLVFLGLLMGLGLSASRDPRPAANLRLAEIFRQLTDLRKDK